MTDNASRTDTYTFGDTPTASDRLRLLAEVYEPPTRELLRRWAPRRPDHAVDLGCGPGHSTRLLYDVTRCPAHHRRRPFGRLRGAGRSRHRDGDRLR